MKGRRTPVTIEGLVERLELGPADEYYVTLKVSRETFEAHALPGGAAAAAAGRPVPRGARRAHVKR